MTDSLPFQLGYQIKRTQLMLRQRMDDELRRIGLTTPQYIALRILQVTPGLSNAELARRAFVTAQTMNKIVLKLEETGLLVRHPHLTHGRVQEALLTERAYELLRQGFPLIEAIADDLVSGLDEVEQRRLLALLIACTDTLHEKGYS